MEIFDLASLPFYNRDLEEVGVPEPVELFRRAIVAADALLIATPEYNYSIPGVLKNAVDWASRPPASPLDGKAAAIMGAGGRFGTVRAQLHLRHIALHNSMQVMLDPEIHVDRARSKFDERGRLTDEATRQQVRELLEALIDWARLWRGDRPPNQPDQS